MEKIKLITEQTNSKNMNESFGVPQSLELVSQKIGQDISEASARLNNLQSYKKRIDNAKLNLDAIVDKVYGYTKHTDLVIHQQSFDVDAVALIVVFKKTKPMNEAKLDILKKAFHNKISQKSISAGFYDSEEEIIGQIEFL